MSDMVFGAMGLSSFLAVSFIAGYFLYMFKNARFKNAWGPLVSLVDGKVVDDGGGGATSWLVGSYKGWKVQASMTPGRNMYSQNDSSGPKYNYFEIALADVPGKHDWSVIYDRKILGVGQTGWRVKSEDPAMEESLTAAALRSLLFPFAAPANSFTFPPRE